MSVSLRVSCVYPYAALLSLCLRGRTCHGRCERPQRPTLGPHAPSRRPPRIQSSRMTRLGLQTDTSAVRNRLRHRRRPQCWAEPCGGRLDQICFWPHAQVRILFLPDLNAKIKLVCLLAYHPMTRAAIRRLGPPTAMLGRALWWAPRSNYVSGCMHRCGDVFCRF